MERGDQFIAFDIKAGYRHFSLRASIRKFFLFHYNGRYFRCIGLPFGWSRSAFWFVNLLKQFVRSLREWGYRVLGYIDDVLVAPSVGRSAIMEDSVDASEKIGALKSRLRLARHQTKGVLGAVLQG